MKGNICMNCTHYKEKGKLVGFCKKFIKIVKADLVRECYEDPINPINTNDSNDSNDTKDVTYKKIIIRDGKKIYI